MSTGLVLGLVAGLAAALLFGLAAVAQAHAVRRFDDDRRPTWSRFVLRVRPRPVDARRGRRPTSPGFVLHAVAIWLLPLYLAQAAIAMSLPVTAVTSTCCCTSGSPPAHWSAVVAVTVGLVLLVRRLRRGRARCVADARFAVALWLGVAAAGARGLARPAASAAACWARWPGSGTPAPRWPCAASGPPVGARRRGLRRRGRRCTACWLLALLARPGPGAGVDRVGAADRRPDLRPRRSSACSCSATACAPGWWPAVVAGLVLAVGGRDLPEPDAGTDRLRSSRRRGDWVFAGSRSTTGSMTSSIAFIVASSSFTPGRLARCR